MGSMFDKIEPDEYAGEKNWEKAESRLQEEAMRLAVGKGELSNEQIDLIAGGDLLNQCTATSFAAKKLDAPFFGVYGACSTMAEALIAASVFTDAGYADYAVASAGSHFCSAEKQFRTPLEYGSQRPPSAQWTVTGAGAVVLGHEGSVGITAASIGIITDRGVTDANHMGAAMAPAFARTLTSHLRATFSKPSDFDGIFSGDLGVIGMSLAKELLQKDGINLGANYHDCGEMIFDRETQDVHSGGSGCGCSASVLCAHILPSLERGELKRVLFVATGALLSPTTVLQGESIPCIAHCVELKRL